MGEAPAVEVTGYLDAAVGVGEAARRYVVALRRAGVAVRANDLGLPGRDPAGAALPVASQPDAATVQFDLMCLNPEQMVPYLDLATATALGAAPAPAPQRIAVGIWSWEVDVVPPGWREAAARVSEVWTYSEFAAKLIGEAIDVPVHAFAPPLWIERAQPAPPPRELPDGFRFLVVFDYLSTIQRKNPIGAIQAYRDAFDAGDGACLVVKSMNGRHRPGAAAEVARAARGRADIVLLDRTMSGSELHALTSACDCVISLHRSEGHGLPLAEAMALGKPVLATDYGGNCEFMSAENSYLVGYSLVSVGAGVDHYPADARWADPDLGAASAQLRVIHDAPAAARQRGARAQREVLEQLAPETVGGQMRHRLELLRSEDHSSVDARSGLSARLASWAGAARRRARA